MTIAVTGAAGHVGGNLVRELLTQEREVRALVRKDRRALVGLDLEIVEGDVRDLDSLISAFTGADVVYHAAGLISLMPDSSSQLEATNVHGVRNVVGACIQTGVRRLIHFSSVHALQPEPLDLPVDETRPRVDILSPLTYDASKAAGELQVRAGIERGLDAVILNPTGILGPNDFYPSRQGTYLVMLCQRQMPGLIDGGYDWVDVRDVVSAALSAEKMAAPGSNYLISGHWLSLMDVAKQVEAMSGVPAPKLVFPWSLAKLAVPAATWWAKRQNNQPLFTSASLSAIRSNRQILHSGASKDLNYHPRPFQITLRDTLNWFADAGHIDRLPTT